MQLLKQKNILLNEDKANTIEKINKLGLELATIKNRRYLGNKYALGGFIKSVVENNCHDINVVADIFSGTGAVADMFKQHTVITNDILYSNYLSHVAWFSPSDYREDLVIELIHEFNSIQTKEDNYVRRNFADTFFSANNCSKIGWIRRTIEALWEKKEVNFKEYAILITSLLYAMDRIANTVGHYDAYRKGIIINTPLKLRVLLPSKELSPYNQQYNTDANILIRDLKCDLLYLDPPYNSRQYCDAYHLLENIARWQQPTVHGVAKKMERTNLKSHYSKETAEAAFRDLINNVCDDTKYILLSYNNTAKKGSPRSHAKISDEVILETLGQMGKTTIFEEEYKSFSAGKSNNKENVERLFLCELD